MARERGTRDTTARTAVGGGKSVEPKPKENLLSRCQKALRRPSCGVPLLSVLQSDARSTKPPALATERSSVRDPASLLRMRGFWGRMADLSGCRREQIDV